MIYLIAMRHRLYAQKQRPWHPCLAESAATPQWPNRHYNIEANRARLLTRGSNMVESVRARALHLQALGRLVLLLAIPVLIGAVMWMVALQAQERVSWVRHTFLAELSLQRLLAEVRTAEASQRGFFLTGRPEFRASYRAAQSAVEDEIAQLAQLTADNQQQQARLSRLRPLVERRLRGLAEAPAPNRAAGSNAPEAPPLAGAEKRTDGSIQALANEMLLEEERLLQLRDNALRRTAMRFYGVLILGYGLIVVIVASLYRSVKRHGIQTAQAEARLSALNAELDERIGQRTALLQAREELLNIFVRYVPVAVAMVDREMRYLQVSDRWCTDFGVEREGLAGRSHYELFPDIPERWKAIHQRCLRGETLRAEEDRWEHAGRVTWLRWEVRPWGMHNGLPEGMLILSEDITARKEIQEALRESEATNRTLLDTASQAILTVDGTGTIVQANKMAGEIFGYTARKLVGQPHDILIPSRLRERHHAHRAAFAADPKPRTMGMERNLVGLRKDGTEFPIEVTLSSLETEHGFLAVSFVSDITVRKQAEMKLLESEQRLRALAGSLLTAQEEERRKLARELHDDVTQQLAFLSIELGRLAGEFPESLSEARARVQALQEQTLRASSEVRRISHGLHPSVILDFGLSVALEEFCEEFEKAHGVAIDFEGSPEDVHLDDATATSLYRVAQESVRNAVVHGRATEVHVVLQAAKGWIQLRVQDNGTGFSAEQSHSKTGLGIVSMKERIRLVNGTLTLASEPGRGTTITASVPLTEDRNDQSKDSAC